MQTAVDGAFNTLCTTYKSSRAFLVNPRQFFGDELTIEIEVISKNSQYAGFLICTVPKFFLWMVTG